MVRSFPELATNVSFSTLPYNDYNSPVEIKRPAYLPQKPPLCHCRPSGCQVSKVCILGCILQSRTRVVPERFPLRGKVAVASGDAHEESVVLLQDGRVGDLRDRGVFGRSVHLG